MYNHGNMILPTIINSMLENSSTYQKYFLAMYVTKPFSLKCGDLITT